MRAGAYGDLAVTAGIAGNGGFAVTAGDTSNGGPAAPSELKVGCRLCPRGCGVDRSAATGFCGMPDRVTIARAALHMWEEPCISGNVGSGTVFFSGCTLRCVFCQNYSISTMRQGTEITVDRLAEIFLELQDMGAWNINLVTPTHYVPQIIRALDTAKGRGLSLPVVYNTSGYERVETLRMLDGYVDIYLPDFKYVDRGLAGKYSGAPDYFEIASAALAEMVRQVPEAVFKAPEAALSMPPSGAEMEAVAPQAGKDSQAIASLADAAAQPAQMLRGVIVRHLLLPGCLMDSKRVVRYLYETYGDRIYMSLMNQYTPLPQVAVRFPELNCKVKRKSYDKLVDYALDLGVVNAFIQEGAAAKESFIPDFCPETASQVVGYEARKGGGLAGKAAACQSDGPAGRAAAHKSDV